MFSKSLSPQLLGAESAVNSLTLTDSISGRLRQPRRSHREQSMSIEVSLRRDHTFVARIPLHPAAEKARSASTDVAGMVSKYAYTCSR